MYLIFLGSIKYITVTIGKKSKKSMELKSIMISYALLQFISLPSIIIRQLENTGNRFVSRPAVIERPDLRINCYTIISSPVLSLHILWRNCNF